ncbi:hypothetical protein Acr_26g0007360 [Actinidia rufa]|uniref:Wall-associated receptor kinase galacturonan-binding domain-containing protein n=1 Tax=Actinidia rufa TaxID=165716 RepID=A0A7J0H306_9ERIC|nr:hypothetical protein Acr_26g0007360 [Actinidia rufa]
MASFLFFITSTIFTILVQAVLPVLAQTHPIHVKTCRSYCGNLTVDYPFGTRPGCGHPGFRELLFCINDFLMLHISSGSYRVLDIDYSYRALTLHDPHMSNCDSIVLGYRGNGFVVDPWRSPYLNPAQDNVFMLIGCSSGSPLFQGFPGKHLPCRNVSSMGCEDYYGCPAWKVIGPKRVGSVYGAGPPECCAVPFEAIKAINLTKLECQGYSSAYSLAPVQVDTPGRWAYGIRVEYSLSNNEAFCKTCEATGGSCGYDIEGVHEVCMCGSWNSTSNCDSGEKNFQTYLISFSPFIMDLGPNQSSHSLAQIKAVPSLGLGVLRPSRLCPLILQWTHITSGGHHRRILDFCDCLDDILLKLTELLTVTVADIF